VKIKGDSDEFIFCTADCFVEPEEFRDRYVLPVSRPATSGGFSSRPTSKTSKSLAITAWQGIR